MKRFPKLLLDPFDCSFCSGFKDRSFTKERDAYDDPVQCGVCSEGTESRLCILFYFISFRNLISVLWVRHQRGVCVCVSDKTLYLRVHKIWEGGGTGIFCFIMPPFKASPVLPVLSHHASRWKKCWVMFWTALLCAEIRNRFCKYFKTGFICVFFL